MAGFGPEVLSILREGAPDIASGRELEGLGRSWPVSLFSEQRRLAVEVCGGEGWAWQYRKFLSAVLKLVDIRARDKGVKGVIVWRGAIKAHPSDIALCTAWGLYVVPLAKEAWSEVLKGGPPGEVNRMALRQVARRRETGGRGPSWLVEERRKAVVELLKQRAMGTREIAGAMGIDYESHRAELSEILRGLEKSGLVHRLMPGYVRGLGAIYGTEQAQLDNLERGLFRRYRHEKRVQRISERVLQLLREEGPMTYREVLKRLQDRWGISTERNALVAILVKRLRKGGLVRSRKEASGLRYRVEEPRRSGNQR